MRIAQIAPLYESCPPKLYGGTERVVSYLTEDLVAAGHDVTLFASGDSETAARLVAPCARAIRLQGQGADGVAYHTLMMHQVSKRIDEFDILHFHTDYFHFLKFEDAAHKTITTLHGRLDAASMGDILRDFPAMPLVSISDAQRLPAAWAHWIRTIPHGLPADLYALGTGDGGYLAFVGRVSPEKGPDRAVAIAKGAGVPIRIAAKIDPADRTYFERDIAQLFTDPLVDFIGEIGDSQKSRFFGGALALVFPIDWPEPFGLVMIEAMATGTPTIAFRAGAVHEIIEDGVTGFIVDTIEEAIAAIPKLASLDRGAIRKRFEERFTIRRVTDDYVALYEERAGTEPSRSHSNHVTDDMTRVVNAGR
jgi:glycosyltransferase involved in cell wall biosynthesis